MKRLTALGAVAGMVVFGLLAIVGTAQGSTPPTNGKIAFNLGGPNDSTSGFTINPDGAHLQQIVGWDGSITATSWSPDGKKILATAWSDFFPGAQPATANPDGSGFSLLYRQPLFAPLDLSTHFWSPSGTRLLCHSEGNFGSNPDLAGLYTLRSSDGGGLVRVTTTPQDGSGDVGYGYSPDGSRILFARFDQNGQNGVLYSVKPNGSSTLQLSPTGLAVVGPPNFDEAAASWSPDGSRVTFAASWKAAPGRQFALYVVNADGTHLRQITPSGEGALSAQWSPDGRLIAFSSKRPNQTPPPQVWVVHPDGTGLRQITFGSSTSLAPVWSPDSKKLLFDRVNDNSLWTVNADGTGLSKLTDGGAPYAWGTAPAR
jgi:Tol biopolymer transport system component